SRRDVYWPAQGAGTVQGGIGQLPADIPRQIRHEYSAYDLSSFDLTRSTRRRPQFAESNKAAAQPQRPETSCDLPYIGADEVEQRLERNWPLYVRLDLVDAEALGERLREDVTGDEGDEQALINPPPGRLARLDSQRLKPG